MEEQDVDIPLTYTPAPPQVVVQLKQKLWWLSATLLSAAPTPCPTCSMALEHHDTQTGECQWVNLPGQPLMLKSHLKE